MRLLRLHEGLSDYISIIFQSEGLAVKYLVDSLKIHCFTEKIFHKAHNSMSYRVSSDFIQNISKAYWLTVLILTRKINFLIQRQSYVS